MTDILARLRDGDYRQPLSDQERDDDAREAATDFEDEMYLRGQRASEVASRIEEVASMIGWKDRDKWIERKPRSRRTNGSNRR